MPVRHNKQTIEEITRKHINSGKVDWLAGLGIDLIVERREGCHLWDLSGRKFLDALCDGSTHSFGHRHPDLVACLKRALDTYDIGCQFLSSSPRAELAELLTTHSPNGLDYVHLLPSGSEANDAAIKAARLATGRRRIVVVEHAFHGVTGLAAPASGGRFAAPFQLEETGDWIRVPWNDRQAMGKAVAQDDVAAVLIETIPATLGWPLPDDDYLPHVRQLCDDSGALLVVDEVQTGYGRLGLLWGIDHWQVTPDMLVMAKGAGGGLYPLAYVLMNERAATWLRQDPLTMPSTFGGSELGCIVGRRALELVVQPGFLRNVREREVQLAKRLGAYQNHFAEVVVEIRHLGLALAIKFDHPVGGLMMMSGLYRHGVLAIMAANDHSVVQIKPPLVIDQAQVDDLMTAIEAATHDCFVAQTVDITVAKSLEMS